MSRVSCETTCAVDQAKAGKKPLGHPLGINFLLVNFGCGREMSADRNCGFCPWSERDDLLSRLERCTVWTVQA